MHEVLNTLKDMNKDSGVTPFRISDTYKSSWNNRNVANDDDDNADDAAGGDKLRPKRPKAKSSKAKTGKAKVKPAKVKRAPLTEETNKKRVATGAYEPHVYKEERSNYIEAQKNKRIPYAVACTAWNLSPEKAKLLAGVPVPELVRRRFVPKGSTTNPWA